MKEHHQNIFMEKTQDERIFAPYVEEIDRKKISS